MSRTVTMTTHDALFKEFYGSGKDQSLINKKTPLLSILLKNKKVDWVGDSFVQPVRFGSAVGLGYRSQGQNLPAPGVSPRGKAVFLAKRAYASCEFDREAIIASRSDKGSFARVTASEIESTEEGFKLHMLERALFGDGSGKLGEVQSVTGAGTAGNPWVIVGETNGTNAPKHKKRYYPKNAKLDLFTQGGVYQMTVQVVSASTTTVTCVTVAVGNSVTPVAGDLLYWEGNKDQEVIGLRNLAPAVAGNLYGISQTANPEFRGQIKTITGALDYGDINAIISDLEEEIDSPNVAIAGHKAVTLLKNQSEDAKRYNVAEIKSSDLKIGFKGIQLMSDEGPFPLISSQMCPDDEIWLFKKEYMQIVMRQDFGWFNDDGVLMLRDPNKDVFNSRYGGYFELFCSKPNTVGVIRGFDIPA